jgi:hypothetical protein
MGSTVARLALVVVALTVACARPPVLKPVTTPQAADIRELWIDPVDIRTRDLFAGPEAPPGTPVEGASFAFVATDRTGYSPGYDVRDAAGTEWSVKLGPEAQTEVVSSRVLWAIGYHQPPNYYISSWTLTGANAGAPGAARFRPELADRKVVADWSWYENPFVETRPFKGLVVANLILNNWDWKRSNNKLYELKSPGDGGPSRRYVVRDLGASLGKTTYPAFFRKTGLRGFRQGSRNDLEGYEQQNLIKRVTNGRVEFDYKGMNDRLLDAITADDILWACELMSRVSEQQWLDAFRAGGYPEDARRRYVRKLTAKIAEGHALRRSGLM